MRAFKVYLNGKRLCTAGIGDDGVLCTIINHVTGRGRNELDLRVGGLISPLDEHVDWENRDLRVGDEVRIKIVEIESSDKPKTRHRWDPREQSKMERRYVRATAKKLGWKIETRRK
jgi:hypothetical protein